jgi:hypothetical protein
VDRLLVVLLAATLAACHAQHRPVPDARPFRFERDTFAFANETVWEYHVDPERGTTWWHERDPRPPFSLRCGAIARTARQFAERAAFRADLPPADEATYARLVRAVTATDPRHPRGPRVTIPGYASLRDFSGAHATLLQAVLDGPAASFFQRGNWRMIFPFLPGEQRREAEHIAATIRAGRTVVVHVLRYPELTMNHLVLAYAVDEMPTELRFRTYDPNDAEAPVLLTWRRGARTFTWEHTPYFPGGPVRAYEVYDGLVR